MHKILIRLIHGYQYLVSPMRPPTCRFSPSCSGYACEALAKYGLVKGCWLSLKRVLRCNPWNPGGYDPIP